MNIMFRSHSNFSPISVISAIFVFLAVFGGYQAYSPVPFWDMWNGTLDFYVQTTSGNWGAWWAQHNEHRIFLSRIFFWLDIAIFEGRGWFLLVINYVLMAFVCLIFLRAWRVISVDRVYWPGFFLIAWLFSWIQSNNLTWGFQSQFILAQLVPLAAFYFLHRAAYEERKDTSKNYCISALLGVLSIGSMANGILVLPLMTSYALVVRMTWRRSMLLGILSIICVWLYFYDYNAPSGHGSIIQALQENPLGLLHYVLLYVGGPFYYFFGKGDFGYFIATCAGLFLISSSAVFAWHSVCEPNKNYLSLAMLTFILYIGGTALGTAGGRLTVFGVEQALESRYMTPALMSWAALFLLYLPRFEAIKYRNKTWIPFFALLVIMLPQQLKALESKQNTLFERKIAALALELGIKDQPQIGNIFPSAQWALSIAEAPKRMNLSIFGLAPIRDTDDMFGNPYYENISEYGQCQGSLDEVQAIEGVDDYLSIRGWIFDPIRGQVPDSALLVDEEGIVRGAALTGQVRPDVAETIDAAAELSGFKGYIQSSIQGKSLKIIDPDNGCQFNVIIPSILYNLSKDLNIPSVNVSIDQIQGGNEWLGSDFHRSSFPGMSVVGSFINSDSDVGSIVLQMQRGDRLFYRSGPTEGRQVVEVTNNTNLSTVLPVATEWVELEFSSDLLPDSFEVKFSDNGDGWGEWSAIGLKFGKGKK